MQNLIRKTPYLSMPNHLFACESTNFHKIIISRVVKKLYQSKFGITPSGEMPFKSILIISPVCETIKQHNFIVSTLGETMKLPKKMQPCIVGEIGNFSKKATSPKGETVNSRKNTILTLGEAKYSHKNVV